MNTKQTDFSFEEALNYIDYLASQLNDDSLSIACDTLTKEDISPKKVKLVHCTVMVVKLNNQGLKDGNLKEYVFHTTINLILSIIRSTKTLRHLDVQADGGLMAMFDTPMKKEIEEVINLAARVRSVNDVVLRKYRLILSSQVVSVGMDYGDVICYNSDDPIEDLFFAGEGITTAKKLSEEKDDCVIISNGIYINLSKEIQTKLFANQGDIYGEKYYYSPLINIKMQKWVVENQ